MSQCPKAIRTCEENERLEHLIPANYHRAQSTDEHDLSLAPAICKCEGLFADFCQTFQAGYGHMRSAFTETHRSAKPSVVLSAPNVQRDDRETAEITRLALLHCLGEERLTRRRYVVINYQQCSLLLGGYDFDMTHQQRAQPAHDFIYDIATRSCRAMPTFPPPGRIAFGVSASERYVVIVGGHTFDNVPLSSAFMFDMETMEQGWQHLPAYPHPILAPGVTICHDRVIVIGGCDFLMGHTEMVASHYQMDLEERIWRPHADLNPPRARTLVICMFRDDETEIYAAGGYTLLHGKPTPVGQIDAYDRETDQWKQLTEIPDLRFDHIITLVQTKLFISEEISVEGNTEPADIRPIRMYDFEANHWSTTDVEQAIHQKK